MAKILFELAVEIKNELGISISFINLSGGVGVQYRPDKEGNDIDKICARDFWKGRDSYRKLQDAYFNHVKSKGFDLERGMFVEDTNRKHYTIEEYKKITNYDNTKKILSEMKLELPEVPDINDISKFSIKRDEKILEKNYKTNENGKDEKHLNISVFPSQITL